MNKIFDISKWIEKNSDIIISNLKQESVDVYQFLKHQYINTDITQNLLFQFVYKNFYRIENAGLSSEFKSVYFNLMEENRNKKNQDIGEIIKRLYSIPNLRGLNTFQFSFATKMLNTIDENYPIYDSEVARVFEFKNPTTKELESRIKISVEKIDEIKYSYSCILENELIINTLRLFDQKFLDNSLSDIKKIDFIFWSAGKLKK